MTRFIHASRTWLDWLLRPLCWVGWHVRVRLTGDVHEYIHREAVCASCRRVHWVCFI